MGMVQELSSVPSACEWRRVVVVSQGKGGPVTMALDITNPTAPTFLWEQVDEADSTAIGYTTSRPVVANIYDASDSSNPVDNYVAFWGSGRSVPYGIVHLITRRQVSTSTCGRLVMTIMEPPLSSIRILKVMVRLEGIMVTQSRRFMVRRSI